MEALRRVTTRMRTWIDVPLEEDCGQEEAEAWDDIDGQEFDPGMVRERTCIGHELHRKMNVYEKRPIEERFETTEKPRSR